MIQRHELGLDDQILDVLGILEGTNKGSAGHDYLTFYEPYLRPFRHHSFTLIEFGVLDGGSLRLWRSYFTSARIIGVDVDPRCVEFAAADITVEIGSQDDPAFVDTLVRAHPPSVVIDDASHMAHHIVTTFERVFPAVLPGGIYIIEDAYMHYGWEAKSHAGSTKVSFDDYFSRLATQKVSKLIDPDDNYGIGRYLFNTVASVAFLGGAVIVQKKPAVPDPDALFKAAELIAEQSGLPRHWHGVAALIVARNGPLVQAEHAARKAVNLDEGNADFAQRLGSILYRQNKFEDALQVFKLSLNRRGAYAHAANISAWHWIGACSIRLGRFEDAVTAFQKETELSPGSPSGFEALSSALEKAGRLREAVVQSERAVDLAAGSPDAKRLHALREALVARAGTTPAA